MSSNLPWVTACVPAYRASQYLRGSVLSLLNQTHQRLRVVVINDGDPDPPWAVLADIHDPRLLRFDLALNKGPYFAAAVALEATPDALLLMQDADDLSLPHRLESLLRLMQHYGSGSAVSALGQFSDHPQDGTVLDRPLYSSAPRGFPWSELGSRIPHHGLFDVRVLKELGGYFGGFHFGYDELLTNLILLTGTVSYTPEPLYWRRRRQDSLTRSPLTGMKSMRRQRMRQEMQDIYRLAYRDYQAYVSRRVTRDHFIRSVRARALAKQSAEDGVLIRDLASSLRMAMSKQASFVAVRPRW